MTTARIDVPFWPTSTNNLSWSADNLIAVGGGEAVAVLVPRLNTKGPNNLAWDSINFTINLFTEREIAFCEPLSSGNWSIGEELSLRHVTGLEWSSPGLARFSTCALGILHSNHVLTIWECVGQPHIRDKWKRSLIINHVIQAYYGTSTTDDVERRLVRQRIRSFAWIPAVRKERSSLNRELESHIGQSEHYLAVSTDAGDIIILKVHSPYNLLTPECDRWEATVIHRLQLPQEISRLEHKLKYNGIAPVDGATDLAFSDWDDDAHARLAFILQGRLYVCDLHHEVSAGVKPSIHFDKPVEQKLELSSELSGPLKFTPKSSSLLLFGPDIIINTETSSSLNATPYNHSLDGRWDNISGLAFTADENANLRPNFVSHLSTASSVTSNLPILLEDEPASKQPNWQHAIGETIANFSATYDLGSNVQERTWGIAASPLGDSVATCVTLLPSDSPAHIINSAQLATIAITSEIERNQHPFSTNGGRSLSHDVSAETLLHGLRDRLARDNLVGSSVEAKEATRQLIMGTLGLSELEWSTISDNPQPWSDDKLELDKLDMEGLAACSTYLRARLFYEPNMFFQRTDRLMEIALQRQPQAQLTKENYHHFTSIVLGLPHGLSLGCPLSRKIASAFEAIKAKLDSPGNTLDPSMSGAAPFVEECNICHQEVQFESLRWSRCVGGHQFTRCSLTFLSIMEPGISKSCRICNALCLNQDALPEFQGDKVGVIKNGRRSPDGAGNTSDSVEETNGDGAASNVTLARLLFAACDKCILCGGKFVA